ncbi:MAG: hypothetical protein ACFB9N_16610 [Geitlerinemataceae cyanobacterium]
MKWFLTSASIAILVAVLVLEFIHQESVAAIGTLGFFFLLFAANLDRISEFQASATGVSTKTREIIDRSESALEELKILAIESTRISLSVIQSAGRVEPYSEEQKEEIKSRLIDILAKVKVDESGVSAALSDWYKWVEADYRNGILGLGMPTGASNTLLEDWRELRARTASPEQIEAFLAKYNLLEQRQQYIEDYKYYRIHRQHRDPERWRDRENWGSLKIEE